MQSSTQLVTVGHSTHSLNLIVKLLQENDVSMVADVRAAPYSQHCSQFNREQLKSSLSAYGVDYKYLGTELGIHEDNCAQYVDWMKNSQFSKGIEELIQLSKEKIIAIMCAERDPINCHRMLLVSRELERKGVAVSHIHSTGKLESQEDAMNRFVEESGITEDMFNDQNYLIEMKIAKKLIHARDRRTITAGKFIKQSTSGR